MKSRQDPLAQRVASSHLPLVAKVCLLESIQPIIIQLNHYLLLSVDETQIILTEVRNSLLALLAFLCPNPAELLIQLNSTYDALTQYFG